MVQDADAAMALDLVPVEREVHFFDTVPLGAGAERRLRAGRAAAEQDAVVRFHVSVSNGARS